MAYIKDKVQYFTLRYMLAVLDEHKKQRDYYIGRLAQLNINARDICVCYTKDQILDMLSKGDQPVMKTRSTIDTSKLIEVLNAEAEKVYFTVTMKAGSHATIKSILEQLTIPVDTVFNMDSIDD